MKTMTRRGMVAAIGVAGAGVCVCGMNEGCATFTKKGKTPAKMASGPAVPNQGFFELRSCWKAR